jgi:peptide/nickel transport system substrate-binding protein
MLQKRVKAAPSIALLATAALALSACGGGAGSSQTAGPTQTTLTIAQDAAPTTFAPSFADGSQVYNLQVYDTLTALNSSDQPVPDLATKWTVSPGGLTYTFDLVANATFHDGSAITSKTIKQAMAWEEDPANAQNLGPRFQAVLNNITTPDAHTVVFHLKEPSPGMFDLLSEFLIVNPAKIGNTSTSDAGSGPYMITNVVPGSSYTMEAYPKYFKKGRPALKKIVVRTITDPEAQLAALQSGGVDMIYAASDQIALQLKGNPGFKIQKTPLGALNPYVMMNTSKAPFNSQKVREAIAMAVNRAAMIKVAFPAGSGVPNCQPFAPGSKFYIKSFSGPSCNFNLTAAKQLLAQAGYPKGFSTNIDVSANYGPPNEPDMAQILQSDLARIGIKLAVNVLDGAVQRSNLLGSKFDMIMHSYSSSNADPTFWVPSGTFGPAGGFSTFTSPQLAELINKASVENNSTTRQADYKALASYISQQAYIVDIGTSSTLYIMKSGVTNVGSDIQAWAKLADAKVTG